MAFGITFRTLNNLDAINSLFEEILDAFNNYPNLAILVNNSYKEQDSFDNILNEIQNVINTNLFIKENSSSFEKPVCISFTKDNKWELHINNNVYNTFFNEKNRINHSLDYKRYLNRLKLQQLWHFFRKQETIRLRLHSNLINSKNFDSEQEHERNLGELFSLMATLGSKSIIGSKLAIHNNNIHDIINDEDYIGKIGYKDVMQCIALCNPGQYHFLDYEKDAIIDNVGDIDDHNQIRYINEEYNETYFPEKYFSDESYEYFNNYNNLLKEKLSAFFYTSHTEGYTHCTPTINYKKYICDSVGIKQTTQLGGTRFHIYSTTQRILCIGKRIDNRSIHFLFSA